VTNHLILFPRRSQSCFIPIDEVPSRVDDDGALLFAASANSTGCSTMADGKRRMTSLIHAPWRRRPAVRPSLVVVWYLSKKPASLLLFNGRRGGCSIRRRTIHIVIRWFAHTPTPFCCRRARRRRFFDLSHLLAVLVAGPCKKLSSSSTTTTACSLRR
jgi:hypothetical protein